VDAFRHQAGDKVLENGAEQPLTTTTIKQHHQRPRERSPVQGEGCVKQISGKLRSPATGAAHPCGGASHSQMGNFLRKPSKRKSMKHSRRSINKTKQLPRSATHRQRVIDRVANSDTASADTLKMSQGDAAIDEH